MLINKIIESLYYIDCDMQVKRKTREMRKARYFPLHPMSYTIIPKNDYIEWLHHHHDFLIE